MTIAKTTEIFRVEIDFETGQATLVRGDFLRDNGVLAQRVVEANVPRKSCAMSDVQAQVDALVAAILVHSAPDAPPTADQLVAYAANRRWRKETGGVSVGFGGSVGTKTVMTDDRSKLMIMGAANSAMQDQNFTTGWKMADGDFVTLNAAQALTMAGAVAAHVQGCFAIEAEVDAGILATTVTTVAEVDEAFA